MLLVLLGVICSLFGLLWYFLSEIIKMTNEEELELIEKHRNIKLSRIPINENTFINDIDYYLEKYNNTKVYLESTNQDYKNDLSLISCINCLESILNLHIEAVIGEIEKYITKEYIKNKSSSQTQINKHFRIPPIEELKNYLNSKSYNKYYFTLSDEERMYETNINNLLKYLEGLHKVNISLFNYTLPKHNIKNSTKLTLENKKNYIIVNYEDYIKDLLGYKLNIENEFEINKDINTIIDCDINYIHSKFKEFLI